MKIREKENKDIDLQSEATYFDESVHSRLRLNRIGYANFVC